MEEIPPTSEPSKSIKAISQENVHRICSGQVVLSLAVAVKELVENSIDAGATLVEVKLRDQGLESVEVSDNGSGVEENNIEGMTAKYHTSKLREFVDLATVATFGFRGEALSSLCALSDMSIITRHKSTDVALKIDMNHDGKIIRRQPCARTVGTTVTLTNLFETLPVRRRDFVKNVKKEFNKMCHILQAYCLVCKGVRIICSNQTAKGNKTLILQTHGSNDALAIISAIFGSRQVNELLEVKCPLKGSNGQVKTAESLVEELQEDLGDSIRLTREDVNELLDSRFKLEGYISSCSHGSGRSSKDRQYFYVNSRPCDPKNISKVVNDTYHRFNVNQFPFVYLNILTDRRTVDINLTPDKRQLLLNNEKILLALIKRALIATFDNIPSTYKIQNTTITSIMGLDCKEQQKEECDNEDVVEDEVYTTSTQRFCEVLTQWKHTGDTEGAIASHTRTSKRKCADEIATRTLKMRKIQEYLQGEESKSPNYKSDDEVPSECIPIAAYDRSPIKEEDIPLIEYTATLLKRPENNRTETIEVHQVVELDESMSDDEFLPKTTCNELKTSLSEIELLLAADENIMKEKQLKTKLERLRFKSEINPNQNKSAEAELQQEINKSHFSRMEILGQFNLGFIITKLDTDLFIVDQHATDEKYNFETLQKTTQLQHQPLAIAQTLELTAVNEMVLMDHLMVFEKNGFKFEINQNAPSTKKVRLLGKPFSKNWEFGKEDIDELIFMLQDAPEGTMCRPSRIRAMFASRACRKSVMIGQALKKSTMEMLVKHMGEIEQPWNCPHGRPTMRHLINITMLLGDDGDGEQEKQQENVAMNSPQ